MGQILSTISTTYPRQRFPIKHSKLLLRISRCFKSATHSTNRIVSDFEYSKYHRSEMKACASYVTKRRSVIECGHLNDSDVIRALGRVKNPLSSINASISAARSKDQGVKGSWIVQQRYCFKTKDSQKNGFQRSIFSKLEGCILYEIYRNYNKIVYVKYLI